jgi:cyclophilin family peptidyl-prolyl cis-trans isomerase
METLENRLLMHSPTFQGVVADNRGEVFIQVSEDSRLELNTATVNKNSVQMYEAGPDGLLGNADDTRVAANVRYTPNNGRVLIRGVVPAGNGYRVKVVATRFRNLDGGILDGEFNGAIVRSGNGVAGGNFEFQVKNDKSTTPQVRMYTRQGLITLRMRGDIAPRTVRNFMSYANSGRYDNVFFTRSENDPNPFVIQGGSLQITGDGNSADDVVATQKDPGIAEEFSVSNTRGTLAMAKSGVGNSSTTNQFFFNLADNSFLDAQQFSVFAEVYGTKDQEVADAINAKPVADLTSQIGDDPSTGVNRVPVENEAQAEASLNPFRDLEHIRRIAQRSRVAAL